MDKIYDLIIDSILSEKRCFGRTEIPKKLKHGIDEISESVEYTDKDFVYFMDFL